MKQITSSIFAFFVFMFSTHAQSLRFKPRVSERFDTAYAKGLLSQCSRAVPTNISGFWEISHSDIKILENNFGALYQLTSTDCCWPSAKIDSLQKFGFQYLGVIINKEKYIYVNAFAIAVAEDMQQSDTKFQLKKDAVVVCDGGVHFWGVLFNINTKQFSSLCFNG